MPSTRSDTDSGTTLRSLYEPEGGVRTAFSTKVADYAASRPGYPEGLFEALRSVCPPGEGIRVADIGAGTGLLTQGLLRSGYEVIAVEPNPQMRQASDLLLGRKERYHSVEGSAESIPMASGSVSLITAAQAFHWFDLERARGEFLRVLTPQGRVALIWNDRVAADPLHVAMNELFASFGGAKRTALLDHEDRSNVGRFFGAIPLNEFVWPNEQYLQEDGFVSLVFSRSYIPNRETNEGREIADRVRVLFGRFAAKGKVVVRYRTVAIIGRP